jgi:putative ABC transport system permease protein
MTRLTTRALLTRHLRSAPVGSLLVGTIVGASVFAAALAPRTLAVVNTAELRHELATASPLLVDLRAEGRVGFGQQTDLDTLVGEMDEQIARLHERLPDPLGLAAGPAQWVARTPADDAVPEGPQRARIIVSLALDLEFDDRIRVVDGTPPTAWDATGGDPAEALEVAVSAALAEAARFDVGDVVGYEPVPLRIAAIYEPVDPSDTYWLHQSDLLAPVVNDEPGVLPSVRAGVYLAPGSAVALAPELLAGELDAWIPIDVEALEFAEADQVATQARQITATTTYLPDAGALDFTTGLPDIITAVTERLTTISALLALSVSGLVGVLLAVFALGVRSVIVRRSSALALLAARGASGLHLRGMMALEGALVALPPSVLAGALSALLIPADVGISGWVLPVVLAVAPIALFAALTPSGPRGVRSDLAVRNRSGIRGVAELAIVALAAISLYLLARRGLVATATVVGTDPLLSATPLLLAVAVCVLALRVYPLPLLAVQRRLRRGDGSVGVLGAARAVRDPALGFATAFALVVGVAVVVFSTVFVTTTRVGLEQGARDSVGADLQVSAPRLDDEVVGDIRSLTGVVGVVALTRIPGAPFREGADESTVTLVIADTAALHSLRPAIPVLEYGNDGAQVLASDDWSGGFGTADLRVGDTRVVVTGDLPSDSLPGVARRWLLVDAAAAADLGFAIPEPERVLIDVGANVDPGAMATEVARVVEAAQAPELRVLVRVLDTASELRDARSPAIATLETAFLLAALASLLLTMMTIVVASVSAAAARNRLIGVLRVLGMSTRQVRGVLAWELGPLAVTAVLVGTALGLVLPVIVTGVLDLRPFLGGAAQPGPVVEPLWVVAAIGVFCLTVVVAGTIAVSLGRRFAPAGAIKMGDA